MLKLLLASSLALAEIATPVSSPVENAPVPVRSVIAVKATAPPRIDGSPDDECWKNAEVISDFIVSTPSFGNPAQQKSLVKILYDNNAVYVCAYLYDNPKNVRRQLSERDGSANADWFAVGFDTYNDSQNGYRFQVSAAGVQTDVRVSPNNYDQSWDAVWYSKTSMKSDGWVCEIKIPFSAIRFPKKDLQSWGLQFARYVVGNNELSSFSPVNPNVNGLVNQWGKLLDLRDLNPPLRLSFLPYLTTGFLHEPNSYNPKVMKWSPILNGGMDVNWGIDESFTLNTQLIPDYGQVQSDNLVLNLGPFEQTFQERRPFFTEGTELFNQNVGFDGSSGSIFYSRRIGGRPSLYYDAPYMIDDDESVEKNPSAIQLYNATKITGRTKFGLGIGVLNAVATASHATIKNETTGATHKLLTEPLTNYNILVLDQTLKNNSRVGLVNTSVIRAGDWRDANVTQLNFTVKDKTNTYSFFGYGNMSQVYEKTVRPNPQLGYVVNAGFSKISGKWQCDFSQTVMSDKYDQNDMGILFRANEMTSFAGVKYLDYKPKGAVNNWDVWLSASYSTLYKPVVYQDWGLNFGGNITFKNLWYVGLYSYNKPSWYYDFYEARQPGVKFHHAPVFYAGAYAGSDSRKVFSAQLSLGFGESPIPYDTYIEVSFEPTVRIGDRLSIGYGGTWSHDYRNFGFAGYDDEGRSVIGARQLSSVSNVLTARYAITPLMNINVRARHYWSKAAYEDYYQPDTRGDLQLISYGGNASQNFNVWNIDFVYNWQFAPGSNVILTWKQNIIEGDQLVADNYFVNARKTFETPQTNSVALKVIYYLDYLQLKALDDKRKAKRNVG